MKEADFRVNDCKFSSYLNIYSGLSAYEILREQGMSEQESIVIYDYEVKEEVNGLKLKVSKLCMDNIDGIFVDGNRLCDYEGQKGSHRL